MKTKEQKANKIVELLNEFTDKEIYSELKSIKTKFGLDCYEDLKSIFLVGAWYGAFKVYQLEEGGKEHD